MNQKSSTNGEEEKSSLRRTILGLVATVVIVLLVLSALIAYYPDAEDEDKLCPRIGSGYVGSTWGSKSILSSTEVDVEFGGVSGEPRPTTLTIKLMRDNEDIGTYAFETDEDGPLLWVDGEYVGNLLYADLADNREVNVGDVIRISNLSPDTDYVIAMFWAPTGDCMAKTSFSTPPE